MASEIDTQAIAQQIISEVTRSLAPLIQQAAESADRLMSATEEHKSMARRIDTTLSERAEQHMRSLATAGEQIEARLSDTTRRLYESLGQQIAANRASESKAIAAVTEAGAASERVRGEALAAEKRITAAEKAEAEAKRAIAVREQVERFMVKRALEERDAKLKRKEVLAKLSNEEAERNDRFDQAEQELNRQMNIYFSDVGEQIDKIMNSGESESGETGESEERDD